MYISLTVLVELNSLVASWHKMDVSRLSLKNSAHFSDVIGPVWPVNVPAN